MKEIEIGVKMKIETGPDIFGMDRLRELQADGYIIKDIREGGISMEKTGEPADKEGHVRMYFSGGYFKVILAKPD